MFWLGESSRRESMFKIWWLSEDSEFSFMRVSTNWSFPPFSGPVMDTNLYLATLSKLNKKNIKIMLYFFQFFWTLHTCLHCGNDLLETFCNWDIHLWVCMVYIWQPSWQQTQSLRQSLHFYRQAEFYILLIFPPELLVTLCSKQNWMVHINYFQLINQFNYHIWEIKVTLWTVWSIVERVSILSVVRHGKLWDPIMLSLSNSSTVRKSNSSSKSPNLKFSMQKKLTSKFFWSSSFVSFSFSKIESKSFWQLGSIFSARKVCFFFNSCSLVLKSVFN